MSGSYRTCRECDKTFRVRSHTVIRGKCFVCMPDKKNVSTQAAVREKKSQKDAIQRLSELEKQVEELTVSFQFYGNSVDTFRDSIIDDIIKDAQKELEGVSNEIVEASVNKRITQFKQMLYGRMISLDKDKQSQIDEMKEEIERNANKILSQRTTITALEYELKSIYDKLKSSKLNVKKPEMTEQARYTRTPDSVRKRKYNNRNRYNIGRVSLTKKQYHFLKSLTAVAKTRALELDTTPSQISFTRKKIGIITNVKSVPAFTRLMIGYGLMKRNREITPRGERGARYTWSLVPKVIDYISDA